MNGQDPRFPSHPGSDQPLQPERVSSASPDISNPSPALEEELSSGEPGMNTTTLRRRARFGVLALMIRSAIMQVTVFSGNIFLARLLNPQDFGVFGVVQFVLLFFTFIGDAGLGGALVQRKESPTQRELSSVFFLQFLIALVFMTIVWLGTPYLLQFWSDLPEGSQALLRVLSLCLLLTAMRIIPSIQMERELLFGRLATIEIVQSLVFYGSAVFLAFLGWGVWALVSSVLLQVTAGTAMSIIMRPWRPSLVLDRTHLRFFTRKSAIDLVQQAGFRIVALERAHNQRLLSKAAQRINKALGKRWSPGLVSFAADLDTVQFLIVAERVE